MAGCAETNSFESAQWIDPHASLSLAYTTDRYSLADPPGSKSSTGKADEKIGKAMPDKCVSSQAIPLGSSQGLSKGHHLQLPGARV